MEDTGTTAQPDWEVLHQRALRLAQAYEAVNPKRANVLYLGWEEHLALAKWVSKACTSLCSHSGQLIVNGWRVIRVAERNWLDVGRYEVGSDQPMHRPRA